MTTFFRSLFTAACIILPAHVALGQVIDVPVTITNAREIKIKYAGITGNDELNDTIPKFIAAIGWFKPTSDAGAITFRGRANATTCNFEVSGGGSNFKGTVTFSNPREGAAKVVDALLAKLLPQENIGPLCQSRIVFCVDVSKGKRDIYICDILGGSTKQITNFSSLCVEPAWTPDSTSVAYTRYGTSRTDIFETKVGSLATRRLTSFTGLNVGAAFDPAFKQIAFVGSYEKAVKLYIRELANGKQTRLTSGSSVEASPTWSPSGDAICYVSNEGARVPRLFLINLAAKTKTRIPNIDGVSEATSPDWAKNNKIVYSAKYNGSYKLAVLDVNSKQNKIVLTAPGDWESPSWAPDGRHAVCARSFEGKTLLYIVDTETGKFRQVFGANNRQMMPSWSPGAVR